VFDRSYQFNDNLKLRQHEVSSAPCAEAYFFKMIEGKFSYCIRRNGIQWTNSYKNYANTPYIYVSISGFTRSSIYIYDISSL